MNRYYLMRKAIWIVGIGVIVCVNMIGALPRMYMVGFHTVGNDIAHVREPQGGQGELSIPVQTVGSNGIVVDSDRRVQVYIRTGYKDDLIVYYPRATLMVLAGMAFLQSMLWTWKRWSVAKSGAGDGGAAALSNVERACPTAHDQDHLP